MKSDLQMAYDGSALQDHYMDIDELAPALLAVGNLCKRANSLFNDDRATVNVLVQSDFERKCFLIHLQVVQTFFHQMQTVLGNEDVKTAKNILEWLGLLGVAAPNLIDYFKNKNGRRPIKVTKNDSEGTVTVEFEGDSNNITINQNVYKLANDKQVLSNVKSVLGPLKKEGIDTLEFRESNKVTKIITKKEAINIINRENIEESDNTEIGPQILQARLIIESPHLFEPNSKWKFVHEGRSIFVDISDSGIAEDVRKRGGVRIGDGYLVKLEVTEHTTETGQFRYTYVAKEMIKFLPAVSGSQMDISLFTKDGEEDS